MMNIQVYRRRLFYFLLFKFSARMQETQNFLHPAATRPDRRWPENKKLNATIDKNGIKEFIRYELISKNRLIYQAELVIN